MMRDVTHVSPELERHYEDFYGGISEWRTICADDKFANIRRMLSLGGDSSIQKVVDIGCGEGAVSALLSGIGLDVEGFDISDSAVRAAGERETDAQFYVFDGAEIPRPSKTYDLALLSHVIEHLEHPRVLLHEALRVADLVYIEVPLELTSRTPKNYRWNDIGHINIFSALTFRHLIQSTGMEVVNEQMFNHSLSVLAYERRKALAYPRWLVRELAFRLWPRLAARVFVYHCGILARRPGTTLPQQ
jgi:ubiquinone/menaquinone biosynthesis C-methylase UbiE